MNKYYTGIGSRKTPPYMLKIMEKIAEKLAKEGWILRSGGADGADSAFERGAGKLKEIFYARDCTPRAMEIAKRFHPAWDRMGDFAKKLHGRNSFQILGRDLNSPSEFVICWTPDGCTTHEKRTIETGGTGTAISIASTHKIPVFNLHKKEHMNRLLKWIFESGESAYWVDTGYGCFGIIAQNGTVVRAAPMAHWTVGKNIDYVLNYYRTKKKAKISVV